MNGLLIAILLLVLGCSLVIAVALDRLNIKIRHLDEDIKELQKTIEDEQRH